MAFDWGNIISSVIDFGSDYLQQEEVQDNAQKQQEQAQQTLQGIKDFESPTVEDLTAKLREYVYQGDFTPQQAIAILQEQSKLQGFNISPQILATQYQVMNQLSEIGQGGYTPQMAAGINRAITEGETRARGQREAIADQYEQRGLGGSGNEMLQKLLATQNAANTANQQGLDVAEAAQLAALQALASGGIQANAMRVQETNEQEKVAAAQDAINKFNAQNRQSTANTNTANANQAALTNLQTRQATANANTEILNKNETNRAGAEDLAFGNNLAKARALVSATAPVNTANAAASASNVEQIGQYGNALRDIAKTGTDYYKEQQEEQKKKDAAYAAQVKQSPEYNQTYAQGGRVASAPALKYNGGGMVTKTQEISKKEAVQLLDSLIPRRRFL